VKSRRRGKTISFFSVAGHPGPPDQMAIGRPLVEVAGVRRALEDYCAWQHSGGIEVLKHAYF